jgi:hypothetical protein
MSVSGFRRKNHLMAALSREKRAELVALLRLNAGQAETSDPSIIYPVPEHVRALEPDVVLIVGDRGAGKTQLVRGLEKEEVRSALVRRVAGLRLPDGQVTWCTGWPLSRAGPDQATWRRFVADTRSRDDVVSAWFAYLLRTVADELPAETRTPLGALLSLAGVDVAANLAAYRQNELAVTKALDQLDDTLVAAGRWLVVAYDELDTIVLDDWDSLGAIVRGLVSLWAAYARRWRRIRPKVFLRSDFYKHHREIAGADVAKLAANRVELHWSDKNLYGALIKHVLNKRATREDTSLYLHFEKAVKTEYDRALGHIPKLEDARAAKPFVDRLVSEYMGTDARKGQAFTWLLDHLRDGNRHVLPRTLIWLIEYAAEAESDKPRATGSRLLHHISIRNALDRVSKQYRQHAETHEFRWLHGLELRLKRDREVPWTRREIVKLLQTDFEASWGTSGEVRPPGQDAEEVLESLVELGVVRRRREDSFDVPDLYLEGLALKRKGGVARR